MRYFKKMTVNSVFLDFEGDIKGNFYLAGIIKNQQFEQIILDKRLSGLGNYRNLQISNAKTFLENICELKNNLCIYGYSIHEKEVFNELVENHSLRKSNFKYVNLLKAAKSWIYKCHKESFENLPPFRKGAKPYQAKRLKNSLASIMRLTEFQSKSDYAPGKTTKRFNMGIKGLERHNQEYEKLTKSQKRDLTQALDHNEYDVRALPILLKHIESEHPSALKRATTNLFE